VSKPDIERLRVLVIANVTPGPWRFDGPHVIGGVEAGFHAYVACRQAPGGITNGDPGATAKLIAACDPQTILCLINAASEAEALRADAERWRMLPIVVTDLDLERLLRDIDAAIAASKPAAEAKP